MTQKLFHRVNISKFILGQPILPHLPYLSKGIIGWPRYGTLGNSGNRTQFWSKHQITQSIFPDYSLNVCLFPSKISLKDCFVSQKLSKIHRNAIMTRIEFPSNQLPSWLSSAYGLMTNYSFLRFLYTRIHPNVIYWP
jgi:hypothetical protein